MANHLLEHVQDDRQVLREFHRVMKPRGWGIFQVPVDYTSEETAENPDVTDPMERERLYWQQDHVRLYGHKDYPLRLKKAGFHVDIVDMQALLGEQLYTRYSLGEERWVYLVTKS